MKNLKKFCVLTTKTLILIALTALLYAFITLVFGVPYAFLTRAGDYSTLVAISSYPAALLLFVIYSVENMEEDGRKILWRLPTSKIFWIWTALVCLPIFFNGIAIGLDGIGWQLIGAYVFKMRYYPLLIPVTGVFMFIASFTRLKTE